MIALELSSECKLPITGSAGREAFFDINSSNPGDFIHPVLFDDETWSVNTSAELTWVFFKGDPLSEPTAEHPFDMPFAPSTLFSIDLLDSSNSTLQSVMRELVPERGALLINANKTRQHQPIPLLSGMPAHLLVIRMASTCSQSPVSRTAHVRQTHLV